MRERSPTQALLRHDATLAVALGVLMLVSALLEGRRWPEALAAAALCGPLAWRVRSPPVVLATVVAGAVAYLVVAEPSPTILPPALVALYTVAAHGSRRRTLMVAAGVPALTLAVVLIFSPEEGPLLQQFLQIVTQLGLPLAVGEAVRVQRALIAAMRERAERAEHDREVEAQRRVDEERIRIARDVHDVVAHSIATISTQASVGVHVGAQDPERAVELLEGIKEVSAQALHDLRHALGVLRDPAANGEPAGPTPTVGDLPALVGQARGSGLAVVLEMEGSPAALPTAVQVAVYRIVQEGLTNVMRHAEGARTTVRVTVAPDEVVVAVEDDGSGVPTAASADGARAGLLGMRERVGALGGVLDSGRRADGGFGVHAVLPLDEAPA